jgi:hypothetical protein
MFRISADYTNPNRRFPSSTKTFRLYSSFRIFVRRSCAYRSRLSQPHFHCPIDASCTRFAASRRNGVYAGGALASSLRGCFLLRIYLKIRGFYLPPDPGDCILYQHILSECGGGGGTFGVLLHGNSCFHAGDSMRRGVRACQASANKK